MQKSGLKKSIRMRLLAVMTAAVMMTSAVFALAEPVTSYAAIGTEVPTMVTTNESLLSGSYNLLAMLTVGKWWQHIRALAKKAVPIIGREQMPNAYVLGATRSSTEEPDSGESLYVKGWDITDNDAPLAYQSLTYAAESVGGIVLEAVEMNYGKMSAGEFIEFDENTYYRSTFELPDNADISKKHTLARVISGGEIEILENLSEDPNFIICDIPGGEAAYAAIEY